jgi:hypothetical protein
MPREEKSKVQDFNPELQKKLMDNKANNTDALATC